MKSNCIVALVLAGSIGMIMVGCKKLVTVPEPVNSITTSETFSTPGTATSALIGVYNDLVSGHGDGDGSYANCQTTFILGLSADELTYYNQTDPSYYQFQSNTLQASNSRVFSNFWDPAYFDVYSCNAVIEGVNASLALTASTKKQLIGEAEFLRAFVYFYLVNFFGDVPLVMLTDYKKNSFLPRSPVATVYRQIVSDLSDAQTILPGDYSISSGQRYRANKWAATALLARVYLYMGNWAGADSAATAVISNSSLYGLVPSLDSVFLANSNEAILQLIPNSNSQFATEEGFQLIPDPVNTGLATYSLTSELLNAFEAGDQRRNKWVDSTVYSGAVYYFPFKYEVKTSSAGNIPEYYMLLRLGEQYLIRAEAEVYGAGGGIAAAISDVDMIRSRAGLGNYVGGSDTTSVLNAITHERQTELFAEWGHRWLDLKRWGTAQSVLSATKSFAIPRDQLLYPVPFSELVVDVNLSQNPGY